MPTTRLGLLTAWSAAAWLPSSAAFVMRPAERGATLMRPLSGSTSTQLFAEEGKSAPLVSGEELEMLLTEMEQPLVIDAYATWYD